MTQVTLFQLACSREEERDLNAKRIISVVVPVSSLGGALIGSPVTYGDPMVNEAKTGWRFRLAEIVSMGPSYRRSGEYVRLVKFKKLYVHCDRPQMVGRIV